MRTVRTNVRAGKKKQSRDCKGKPFKPNLSKWEHIWVENPWVCWQIDVVFYAISGCELKLLFLFFYSQVHHLLSPALQYGCLSVCGEKQDGRSASKKSRDTSGMWVHDSSRKRLIWLLSQLIDWRIAGFTSYAILTQNLRSSRIFCTF